MKTPEQFENSHLDALDFDGTMFDTFEQDPARGIYGIDEAYREAIHRTFPEDEDALKVYEDIGGHSNRSPLEIIHAMFPAMPKSTLDNFAGYLVRHKLDILEAQIGIELPDGERWPRPVPGFLEYTNAVDVAKSHGHDITQAIISAGHTSFIRKCLNNCGIPEPDILITNKTIVGLSTSMSAEMFTKPSIATLQLAVMQWKMLFGVKETLERGPTGYSDRITVIGDSDEKDGGLARNAGVRFIHIRKGEELIAWRKAISIHGIGGLAVANQDAEVK